MPAWCSSRTSSPASRSAPTRSATTAQKCVRAGGKHNDLDNVGYTARHHTFFEMLGNFSFGDYFKERAIELAWNLVTKEFGAAEGAPAGSRSIRPTTQARKLWKKIAGLPDERIIGHKDNLWAMGPIGPCGYCSEIFYDQGDKLHGGPPGSPEEDGDRFLEFWNLVFMQFEQVDENTRLDLPQARRSTPAWGSSASPRSCRACTNNYDIDLFRALIAAVRRAYRRAVERGETRRARASSPTICAPPSFLIADGVLPSNEGRGYVLRRIMRRAMRHAELLGATRAADVAAGAGAGARDGTGLSRTRARRGADRRNAEARRNPLPQDAGARAVDSRRRQQERSRRATCSTARPPSRSTTLMASRST